MPTKFFLRAANGQIYPITGPFRIGREPECQIQIDSNLISRIHASIWIDHDHLLLRDERSRNGTLLNKEALAPGEAVYLHHDDEVRVGDSVLTVVSDPPYPRPRQHRGLAGLEEDEPPPTAKVDKQSAPPPPPPSAAAVVLPAARAAAPGQAAPPPPGAAAAPIPPPPPRGLAPAAPPARSNRLLLAIGGCVLLAVIVGCCVLGIFLAARFGPGLKLPVPPASAALFVVWRAAREPAASGDGPHER
jgi:predicted component of type VI protein secretion system